MVTHWDDATMQRFLRLRQELFLDPLGSNRKRFEEAAVLLQRALFSWYFSKPGEFSGLLSLVQQHAAETRLLRKDEAATIQERRFALNYPAPDIPAIESGVSENQWQQIYGSLGAGHGTGQMFERFLIDLDQYTNPSLRINHRYLGELLPHDNMVSYFSSVAATFLNENAIIGKVSPCVTHMEQAATAMLAQLVGWDGRMEIADERPKHLPLQRLPTVYPPARHHEQWAREQPTGTIVGDGTIANISALLIARNATFNYLLGWGEAVQELGPSVCWKIIEEAYGYKRMAVVTSKGAHYSVLKAAHQAGIGPLDIIEAPGSTNPWILDGDSLQNALRPIKNSGDCLLVAVVVIAGKTETGYIDRIGEAAKVLEEYPHKELETVYEDKRPKILELIKRHGAALLAGVDYGKDRYDDLIKAFESLKDELDYPGRDDKTYYQHMLERKEGEIAGASYNRPFLHVDAAHGGAFLAVPDLRQKDFEGIESADTVTLDGHKMFYCYYPCGGLLIRAARWARTLYSGHSSYISEDTNHEAYGEDREYLSGLAKRNPKPGEDHSLEDHSLIDAALRLGRGEMARLDAIRARSGRPTSAPRSELQHQPFVMCLEGSRGCQGIMQMYFNLRTIGFEGYQALLEWTYLLARRCEEAVSLGSTDVRPVTEEVNTDEAFASAKDRARQITNAVGGDHTKQIIPVLGGRLLRLSAGRCNQLLVSYIPRNIAMDICTRVEQEWTGVDVRRGDSQVNTYNKPGSNLFWETMHYLWRVNEHLWYEYLYANPSFTYYVGHTELEPILPSANEGSDIEARRRRLAELFAYWNIWTRWPRPNDEKKAAAEPAAKERPTSEPETEESEFFKVMSNKEPPDFFKVMANCVQDPSQGRGPDQYKEGRVRFFAHKIVVMHPYTDESILSDLLGKMVFWGERSADAVRFADAACADWLDHERPEIDNTPRET